MLDGPGIPYTTFPTLEVGPLTLRTFGLFVALGILAGIMLAARRNERYGIPARQTERIALLLVVVGLVGARLLWVVTNLDVLTSPWQVFAVWQGGLQFSGGFILAILLAPLLTQSIPRGRRWQVLDGAVLGLALGQAVGRLGCYAVGEHLGGPTSFALGVNYRGGTTIEGPLTVGVTYHNTALYEFAWVLLLFGILWLLDRRGTLPPGAIAGLFCIGYAIGRFGTDFLRTYDETLFGLTGAQYMCLALVIAGVWVLIRAFRRGALPAALPTGSGA